MKKKILINLPDDLIETETQKLIKSLTGKVTRLENKVSQLQSCIDNNKETVIRAYKLIEACREAGDFVIIDEYGDQL